LWIQTSSHLWIVQLQSCINVKVIKEIMAMMRVEIKMYDTGKTQQHRAKTKKIGMKYVKLAVLFGLLLCWKVIYLISQPLGDSWANFLAYCWIFSIMFLYLKVTKQTLAKFFYSISMKLVLNGIGLGILLFVSG